MSGKAVKLISDFMKFVCSQRAKGYDNLFSGKIRVVSAGEGNCVCELTVDENMVNVNNHLHGGCTATLVDIVTCLALMTYKNSYIGASFELSLSYMAAAKLGEDIVIDAKTIKWGDNLALMRAEVMRKSDGALIAVGKNSQYVAAEGERLKNAVDTVNSM